MAGRVRVGLVVAVAACALAVANGRIIAAKVRMVEVPAACANHIVS